eukprot:15463881-Alexandrium_andersonii.AAC.1
MRVLSWPGVTCVMTQAVVRGRIMIQGLCALHHCGVRMTVSALIFRRAQACRWPPPGCSSNTGGRPRTTALRDPRSRRGVRRRDARVAAGELVGVMGERVNRARPPNPCRRSSLSPRPSHGGPPGAASPPWG